MHFGYDQSFFFILMNLTGKQIMKGQRWQETARCLLPFLSFQKHRLHFKQPWAKSKCNAAELCLSPWHGGRGASVKPGTRYLPDELHV